MEKQKVTKALIDAQLLAAELMWGIDRKHIWFVDAGDSVYTNLEEEGARPNPNTTMDTLYLDKELLAFRDTSLNPFQIRITSGAGEIVTDIGGPSEVGL